MHALVIITFLTATLAEFLSTSTKAPGALKLIPEMLTVLITVGVMLQGVRRGFGSIPAKYWMVFGVLSVIIVCGVLTNGEGSGPIVAGARYYLRAIPLFILPAVYPFTDKQLKQQMWVVLGVGLIQVPIACYQRWVIYSAGRFSGDDVYGTMMESGILSIVLICIVLVMTGQLLRKRMGWTTYIILFFLLLLPTTINETKVTVVILPLGLLTAIVAAAPSGKKLPIAFGGLGLLVAFAAILVPIYDFMNAHSRYKQGRNIEDFFTDQKLMATYMATQKRGAALGMTRDVRRGDAIKVPLHYLSKDPIRLAFGLGMGNASHSNIGVAFTGDYNGLFDKFLITAFTTFLLEIGLFGVSLIFALYWFIWQDTIAVAKLDDGLIGSLAAGWIGVAAVIPFATFYAPIQTYASISYLFWYFSGVIVARRSALKMAALQAAASSRRVLPKRVPATTRIGPADTSVGFVAARNNENRLN
jgi:hypothetical protein